MAPNNRQDGMAAKNRQADRIARLDTPLGEDDLVLSRFDGKEGLSEIFEFNVEALSHLPNINPDKLIGRTATITFNTIDSRKRYFNGHISDFEWVGVRNDNFVYRLRLKPWLWLMSFTSDCCIFHNKTVVEIIEEVFNRRGFAKFKNKLTKPYKKLEYTVQYRETDMDFVRRMMEQNGIGFYFKHDEHEHKLVLSDAASSYETIEGGARPFIGLDNQHRRNTEHFFTWTPERTFTTGAVMYEDYDFKKPTTEMKVDEKGTAAYDNGQLELYDYPGVYSEPADGKTYAGHLLTGLRAMDGRFRSAGNCVSACPGSLMTLKEHHDKDHNREYLIVRCVHSFVAEDYRTVSQVSDEEPYEGSFEFLPASQPYAPPQCTAAPTIPGPLTAIVVGNGEIDVDEYGRITVQFYWDRHGEKSMRCRLAQVWAGKGWGGMYIPRVGMEVIVQFIAGNPNYPIVIGTVYNADNMPPFPLPDKKNIAGVKSNSTTGGGGYNEYVFDDTKGCELIRQHGQYNLESVVEHDEDWHIKNDRNTKIDNNETRKVGVNRTTTIGTNDTLDVGSTLTIKAKDKIYIEVGGAAGSKITMTPGKIEIESQMIEIKAKSQLKSSALLSEHSAGTLMDIKGLLVKINS